MDKQLVLVFNTETEGRSFIMRFNNPKDNITSEQIQDFMNWIIQQNIFLTRYGELVSVRDGGIVERNFNDLIP
ncbi:MAG: DUF2922 domain-containing protein [Caldisericia bacterium]|jgi:hypothetical protein|nr:DUF2922 domain-containing protein [Caldisericia bacterium]